MLEIIDVWKSFENKLLLKGVSFHVDEGETVSLLGPSGSGKSTILRIIAGLEEPEAGQILWGGKDLRSVPAYKRHFGLMFQDYALFPHRSVAQNVAFGLRMQVLPKAEIDRRVKEALERVNMGGFAGRRVTELSGGEQQRVALARALAPNPRLLMLDEPLAALDRTLREQLSEELRLILRQTGIPAIYVTHDQEEAFAIADRLVLINQGLVVQNGTPEQVYAHPISTWVARFFGLNNLIPGNVSKIDPLTVQTAAGNFTPTCPDQQPGLGEKIWILLRPYGAHLASGLTLNCIQGRVKDAFFQGSAFQVRLDVPQVGELSFLLPAAPPIDQPISLELNSDNILCVMDEHGQDYHH